MEKKTGNGEFLSLSAIEGFENATSLFTVASTPLSCGGQAHDRGAPPTNSRMKGCK